MVVYFQMPHSVVTVMSVKDCQWRQFHLKGNVMLKNIMSEAEVSLWRKTIDDKLLCDHKGQQKIS